MAFASSRGSARSLAAGMNVAPAVSSGRPSGSISQSGINNPPQCSPHQIWFAADHLIAVGSVIAVNPLPAHATPNESHSDVQHVNVYALDKDSIYRVRSTEGLLFINLTNQLFHCY